MHSNFNNSLTTNNIENTKGSIIYFSYCLMCLMFIFIGRDCETLLKFIIDEEKDDFSEWKMNKEDNVTNEKNGIFIKRSWNCGKLPL